MNGLHRAVALLGPALVLPLAIVACGSSGSSSASCGSNSKITVKSGTITYAPQANLVQAAGVMTTPLAPATISSDGAIQLPISGGSFNSSSYAGSINTEGGVKLSGPSGKSVSLTKFTVNTQNGVVTPVVNGQPVQLLQIAGSPTVYRGLIRGTLSTISNSSKRINNPPVPATAIAVGGGALDQDLAVGTLTRGLQIGTLASSITYSC